MRRQPSARSIAAAVFASAIWIAVGLIAIAVQFLITHWIVGIIILAAVVAAIWIGVQTKRDLARAKRKAYDDAKQKIAVVAGIHVETLGRRRNMLVRSDRYGVVDRSSWEKELQHFVDNVIAKELVGLEAEVFATDAALREYCRAYVEDVAAHWAQQDKGTLNFRKDMSPLEFEVWCAGVLKAHGWSTTTTSATGDQGADVVAAKAGLRVVIQCKLYSSAVGNKSVQEVFAAKKHYSAQVAIVLTNATFTASAQELARSTNVILMHSSDLLRLAKFDPRSGSTLRS